ncbi:MAG: four helix bundle protein [Terracidiphilus sp.]
MANSFKDLIVWQRSIQLTVSVYKLTSGFPEAERFGLTNQLRRASVSIASNIAEGYGKSSKGGISPIPRPRARLLRGG